MKLLRLLSTIIAGLFLIAGCAAPGNMTLMHIHGLGFTGDGKQILIPAHDGLAVFESGQWKSGVGEKRDYMGFNTVDAGFYSSGHPAQGSSEKNPLGILKSADLGKSIQQLDLYGFEDFHGIGVGFKTHAVYVFNPKPNPRMPAKGLYYSLDDAKTWEKSSMTGVSGEPAMVVAHPTDVSTVAVLTKEGLYLSRDKGNHFEKTSVPFQVTGVTFRINGELMIGGQKAIAIQKDQAAKLEIPSLDQDDAVQYLAQNPANPNEIVFSSYKKSIYLSRDAGATWKEIANAGKTKTEK